MKVKIMEKPNRVWQNIDIQKLKGKSLAHFIADQFDPTVMGVYHEDKEKPEFYVVNTEDLQSSMQDKDKIAFLASDFLNIIGESTFPSLVAEELGGELLCIRKTEPVTDG